MVFYVQFFTRNRHASVRPNIAIGTRQIRDEDQKYVFLTFWRFGIELGVIVGTPW